MTSTTYDIKNGHYANQDDKTYHKAITRLIHYISFDEETRTTGSIEYNSRLLLDMFGFVQLAKTQALIRVAKETLSKIVVNSENTKLCPKIILVTDKMDIVKILSDELKEFNPVELTPNLSMRTKNINLAKFQEQNSDCRVLIAITNLVHHRLNLTDNTGLFPRSMFIMPNFLLKHQNLRFKGVTVRFFYNISDIYEKQIIEAISSKANCLSRLNIYQDEYEDGRSTSKPTSHI